MKKLLQQLCLIFVLGTMIMAPLSPAAKRVVQRIQVAGDDVEEVDAPQTIESSQPITEISKAGAPSMTINLPADFTDTFGKAADISVGSRNGVLEVWGVAPDGSHLLHYNPPSLLQSSGGQAQQAQPSLSSSGEQAPESTQWTPMIAKDMQNKTISPLKSVAISSDGEMFILDTHGKAYRYNWNKQQFAMIRIGHKRSFDKKTRTLTKHVGVPLGIDFITVGNKDNIWGVDVDEKMVYQLDNKTDTWMPMVDGISVSAGLDGFVVSVDDKYVPHVYGGNNKWHPIAGMKLDRVAVGTKNYVYGTYQGFVYRHDKGGWHQLLGADGQPANGIHKIAVNAVGTLFITAPDEIYHKGDDGVTAQKTGTTITVKKAPKHAISRAKEQMRPVAKKPAAKKVAQKPAATLLRPGGFEGQEKVAQKPVEKTPKQRD